MRRITPCAAARPLADPGGPSIPEHATGGIGTVDLDPCAGRYNDPGRLERDVQLLTQQVKHDALSHALLSRTARGKAVIGGR